MGSYAFVCGNLSGHFLSTAVTFQVAATIAAVSTVYMGFFLPDSVQDDRPTVSILSSERVSVALQEEDPDKKIEIFRTMPSVRDVVVPLLTSRSVHVSLIFSFFFSPNDIAPF